MEGTVQVGLTGILLPIFITPKKAQNDIVKPAKKIVSTALERMLKQPRPPQKMTSLDKRDFHQDWKAFKVRATEVAIKPR